MAIIHCFIRASWMKTLKYLLHENDKNYWICDSSIKNISKKNITLKSKVKYWNNFFGNSKINKYKGRSFLNKFINII